jgi:hypothetical protein
MTKVLVALMIVALAVPAFAGGNPDIRVWLDLDENGGGVHRIDGLGLFETFNVYIVLDCFGDGSGTRGLGFRFEKDADLNASATGITNLLGGQTLGSNPESADGVTLVAGTDCVYPDVNGIVVAGYVEYTYGMGAGYINMLGDHPVSGRQVLDCDYNDDDLYCIVAHVAVGEDPQPGEPDCECEPPSPVEDSTWGSIKALYK